MLRTRFSNVFLNDSRAGALDAPVERIVANGRVILAVFALLASEVDVDLLGYRGAAFKLLVAYSCLAIVLAAIRVWRIPGRSTPYVIHCVDLAFVVALGVLAGERAHSLLALFTLCVLLAANLRWSWKAALATGGILALAICCFAIGRAVGNGAWENAIFLQALYVVLWATMIAYFSAVVDRRYQQLTRLTQWPGPDLSEAVRPNLANLLAHCATALEAPRMLVLWEEDEEPFANVAIWRDGKYKHEREIAGSFGSFVRSQQYEAAAFWTDDASSTFASMANGPVCLRAPILDDSLIKSFTVHGVISAPFVGVSCKGRVFVLDRPTWSDCQLQLIQIIASRLANALDREIMQSQAKEAIAEWERARLIRDLHDGLLQSLTAAGLQIKVIANNQEPETKAGLEIVRQLLVAEQRRIREVMRRTPLQTPERKQLALSEHLQNSLSGMAKHWNCKTSLKVDPLSLMADAKLCVHLSLMLEEAVANAVRHGRASSVAVTIQKDDQHITMRIRDDGLGFVDHKMEQVATVTSVGPVSIRNRVNELGGLLEVRSSPRGVELQIQLPLP
jgi:signal transduction histidine kinase